MATKNLRRKSRICRIVFGGYIESCNVLIACISSPELREISICVISQMSFFNFFLRKKLGKMSFSREKM